MNKEFVKDFSKAVLSEDVSSGLSPGSGRRYDPASGVRKHNERIHRESRFADNYKNLPFTFSTPKKPKTQIIVRCCNCGHITSVNRNTVGVICSECRIYSSVREVDLNKEVE